MIFYYSGTGNSEYAAKELLAEGEQLISMAKACRKGELEYLPAAEEPVGFVFPVYFYGLPDTVRRFAQQVKFSAKPAYVYAVITCGGSIAGAGGLLKDALAENGTELRAVYSVKMPDNYVLLYDATTVEEEKPILAAAREKLAEIRGSIALRRFVGTKVSVAAKLQTKALYAMYDSSRKTAKFYTDETCVGCGACAARCPVGAIEMVDGKPVWVKEKCDHCLACIRCNAVQYGKRTVGRYRYVHPMLRKKEGGSQ